MRSTSSSVKPFRAPETISSRVVPGWPDRRGQGLELGAVGGPRGDGEAGAVVVGVGLGGREAERPLLERPLQLLDHGRHLGG